MVGIHDIIYYTSYMYGWYTCLYHLLVFKYLGGYTPKPYMTQVTVILT